MLKAVPKMSRVLLLRTLADYGFLTTCKANRQAISSFSQVLFQSQTNQNSTRTKQPKQNSLTMYCPITYSPTLIPTRMATKIWTLTFLTTETHYRIGTFPTLPFAILK